MISRRFKYLPFLFIFILSVTYTVAQEKKMVPSVLGSERVKFRERTDAVVEKTSSLGLADSTEGKYQEAFWLAQLSLKRNDKVFMILQRSFDYYPIATGGFRRALLEAAYTLYPDSFNARIDTMIRTENEAKLFAMMSHYLVRGGGDKKRIYALLNSRFTQWESNPILSSLALYLTGRRYAKSPPLEGLLKTDVYKGRLIIYSIQRPDRNYPGIAIIRLPDSNFLLENSGKLFYIKQLARSISNLPGYITNGNTPTGVFSVQGTAISENIFIGPTLNLQTILPFEDSTQKFMNNAAFAGKEFTEQLYNSLLPELWTNSPMIFEAFRAGKAGRNEIIAHGTTIDVSFYKDELYYPNTPSLGCLCAPEIWSEETGELISSEQLRLMDALKSYDLSNALLIVVETDDQKKPVDPEEIERLIRGSNSSK
ncbi:MAG: hypothetical protein HUU54_02465 [Ignavibacteriaceae bacterium]|nr:hypothetical protein [Ignavibacteriaceae bacterium]